MITVFTLPVSRPEHEIVAQHQLSFGQINSFPDQICISLYVRISLYSFQNSKSAYLALDWIYSHSALSVSLQSAQSQTHINFDLGQHSQSCDQGVPKTASKTPKTMRGKFIFLFIDKIRSRIYKPPLLYPLRNRTQLMLYMSRR